MKISIRNFKTIKSLKDFEFSPFNIISGVNSSGKSSFIQFLLLLKQTIEDGQKDALLLNGFIKLGSYPDIVYRHEKETKLGLEIALSSDEFSQEDIEYLSLNECRVAFELSFDGNEIAVDSFQATYFLPTEVKNQLTLRFQRIPGTKQYQSKTNSGAFNNDLFQIPISVGVEYMDGGLDSENFFPRLFTIEVENENYPDLDKNPTKQISIEPRLENIMAAVKEYFKSISYLGPLREEPRDSYKVAKTTTEIGPRGEFVAYILEKEAKNEVEYYTTSVGSDGVLSFTHKKSTLVDAVNYWICEVFELARSIYAEEIREEYVVYVVNHFDVKTTIKHVGFGISQVLPIVVEGLRLKSGGTLILEQPEIHLHPRIQSLLFDYLYTLTLTRKKIIVETHSDHFIIRMRRRIAESKDGDFAKKFNLLFIEERDAEHLFRKLDLTELGSLSYFPKNFVEQQDNDYRAIVKAQARKKTSAQ